jgi:hypothetical protein
VTSEQYEVLAVRYMYAAFDQIREPGAEPGARVVAGHDPLVAERFGGRAGSADVIQVSP